jgi:hypothetical protein
MRSCLFQRTLAMLLASLVLLSIAGCITPAGPRTALELTVVTAVEPDRFAIGRRLLPDNSMPRLAGASARDSWLPGDAVLFGVAVDAGAERREWYVRARVIGKIMSEFEGSPFAMGDSVRVRRAGVGDWVRIDYDVVRVAIELFDGDGHLLSSSEALMPELCLQYGLYEYIELSQQGRDPFAAGALSYGEHGELMADDDVRRAVSGWIAMMKLPEFLQRDSGMEQLLWKLIERPSLLSIVANRGVQMEVGLNGKDARPVPSGSVYGPAYRVPVLLTLNNRPAVRCEIVVARGAPPLGPCNGLLAIDATHPSDPSRRIAVRLLAAQRGAPDHALVSR